MKTPFDRAREIYDRWQYDDDLTVLGSCIDDLTKLLCEDDYDGEVNYISGLLVYEREWLQKGDTDIALRHFEEAKKLNPSHYMACLYSGHCHHDKKRHGDALKEYESVDIERLRKEYPVWRYVKLQEQKGECLYRIGKKNKAIELFKEVLSFYDNTDPDELVIPSELLRTLEPTHPISIKLNNWPEKN